MKFDIVIVTYNSSKWVSTCLDSIRNSKYPIEKLHLTIIDNKSADDTRDLVANYPHQQRFGSYNWIFSDTNLGFGRANNLGVKKSNQEYVFFLNIDTEVDNNCFKYLERGIQRSPSNAVLWECRQFPYEHPKYYNPVNLETSWSSGAACVVKRKEFFEVGMFDEKIFMYAEDVDLSWRFRAAGYKLIYSADCIVHHYTYQSAREVKPNQYYNSTYNNLMLRYKYGNWRDIAKGYVLFGGLIAVPAPFKGHHKKIVRSLIKSVSQGQSFRHRNRSVRSSGFRPSFRIWDYEIVREGAFHVNELPDQKPLVSILIRTCGRPDVLREALLTVRYQTYSNIEVVIVEDGPAVSEEMINREFSDLCINYSSTGTNVGRCIVGNIALERAVGQYFNFLDDDDVLFSDHVEVLVKQLEQRVDLKVVYSMAFETPIRLISRTPYRYEEMSRNLIHKQSFNRLVLLHHNYFPIQTVMFSRELFDKLGGFDLNLEVLEDWDLWLRYAFETEFHYVEKVTSMYRVPHDSSINIERQELLDRYLRIVRDKHAANGAAMPVRGIVIDIEGFMSKGIVVMNQIRKGRFDVLLFKIKNKIKSKIKRAMNR